MSMRGWILAFVAMAGSVPGLAAEPAIELPIVPGFWTTETEQCATVYHGYVFDGTRWGALYYYGPGGTMGPAAELEPITQTRALDDGFTQMQFGGYDGAGYFRVKPLGTDRALYRVGAPFRDDIQVSDEPLIRCDFKALSPKMQAALRRNAPGLVK